MREERRSLPALHLKKSPLVLVLAQVRIGPVLKMSEFIPDIQERLRHEGFPGFLATEVQQIVFGPQVSVERSSRWLFPSKNRETAVSLTSGSIVLESSAYGTFDTFLDVFATVLRSIGDVLELSANGIVQRSGLRYVDLIRLKEKETWQEYLKPPLIGFTAEELNVASVLQRSEWRGRSTAGQLVIRASYSNDGTFLPPDLQSDDLRFGLTVPADEVVSVLDIDHYSEREREFSIDGLCDDFWALHDSCDRSFRAAVTDQALVRWGAAPAP